MIPSAAVSEPTAIFVLRHFQHPVPTGSWFQLTHASTAQSNFVVDKKVADTCICMGQLLSGPMN